MSVGGGDVEGVMELAKPDLDTLKEIASKEIPPDGHGADRRIEIETPEPRMRENKLMNSRANPEARRGVQSHLTSSHQINTQSRHQESAIEDRETPPRYLDKH